MGKHSPGRDLGLELSLESLGRSLQTMDGIKQVEEWYRMRLNMSGAWQAREGLKFSAEQFGLESKAIGSHWKLEKMT